MKSKTTQFPAPFQYKRSDPDIFGQESTIISSSRQLEISSWRENKSFEMRKAAISKSKKESIELIPPNETSKDRCIRNKIKDINRLINMVKSRYSNNSFASAVYNSTTLNNSSVLKDQRKNVYYKPNNDRKLKKKKLEYNDLDVQLHSNKPLIHPSIGENPLRRRFNTQYDRAYRQVISNFFRS